MSAHDSVIIIGGGITGVLSAYKLAKEGFTVTLLEAEHIGSGSSSRTAAGIRQQFSTPASVRAMRFSVNAYIALATELSLSEPLLIQNGYLFLFNTPEALDAARVRVEMQQGAGLKDVELLEADALELKFPWLASGAHLGGTFCPSDGFLLPATIYQTVSEAARTLGVQIIQKAPVTSAVTDNGSIVHIETPKGRFSAATYIDCTNAWSPRLATLLGAATLPISPIKRYLWFLDRGEVMDEAQFLGMPLTVLPSGVYLRPENAAVLQVGWAHQATAEPNFSREDQDTIAALFSHEGDLDARPYEAWMTIAESVPAAEEFAGLTATTAGFYAVTPDHNPFMGFDPVLSNLIRMVGFSGHGAMFGPFSAEVACALVTAKRNIDVITLNGEDIPLHAFHISRDTSSCEAMVI
jgi:glycine/D-amino acid oxidase-like deaminating enzyme